jgi:tetratricopeptide (TPR) repeat protein
MKKLVMLSCILLFSLICTAQKVKYTHTATENKKAQHIYDSVLSALTYQLDSLEDVLGDYYFNKADSLDKIKEYNEATAWIKKAIESYKKSKNTKDIGLSYWKWALIQEDIATKSCNFKEYSILILKSIEFSKVAITYLYKHYYKATAEVYEYLSQLYTSIEDNVNSNNCTNKSQEYYYKIIE